MTGFTRTHVVVDGKVHKIHRVEDHVEGPRHTHRVHLGCGLTLDVDLDGQRHARAAEEHRERALASRRQGDATGHDEAMRHAASLERGASRHRGDADRWRRHEGAAADCAACAAVEKGGAAVEVDLGHNASTTIEADTYTGVRCPQCPGEIRKRRSDGAFACTGNGHVFEPQDLLAQVADGFRNLLKLTEG